MLDNLSTFIPFHVGSRFTDFPCNRQFLCILFHQAWRLEIRDSPRGAFSHLWAESACPRTGEEILGPANRMGGLGRLALLTA